MDFDEYQKATDTTAIFEHDKEIPYLALALCGEAGEVAEKVKKIIRDNDGVFGYHEKWAICLELGDVLYYLANLASAIGYDFSYVAEMNIRKVNDRMERGVLHGKGDNR